MFFFAAKKSIPSKNALPIRDAVDAFKDDLELHLEGYPMELTRGVAEMIEVLPPGASKAVGVEALLQELGISADEVTKSSNYWGGVQWLYRFDRNVLHYEHFRAVGNKT